MTTPTSTVALCGNTQVNPAETGKNWLRALLCIHYVVRPVLLSLLHNEKNDLSYKGLPKDKKKLYNEITSLKSTKIEDFKVLKKDQMEIALPTDGKNETDSSMFDVTMLKFFMWHGTTLPPPRQWKHPKPPLPGDDKRAYACCLAVIERNKLSHPYKVEITDDELDLLWIRLEIIVTDLGYYDDYKDLMTSLKNGSLEPYHQTAVNILQTKVEDLSNVCQSKVNKAEFELLNKKMDTVSNNFEEEISKLFCKMKTLSDGMEKNTRRINELKMVVENGNWLITVERSNYLKLKHDLGTKANVEDVQKIKVDTEAYQADVVKLKKDTKELKEEVVRLKEGVIGGRLEMDVDRSKENVLNGTHEPSYHQNEINTPKNSPIIKAHKIKLRGKDYQLTISSHNAEQVLDHFKSVEIKYKDYIHLCHGNRIVDRFTQKRWLDLSMEYTDTYFSFAQRMVAPVIFPPNYKVHSETSKLSVSFRDYLSTTTSGVGAVISNYNATEHFLFLNDSQTLEDIGISNVGSFENRLLVLQPDHNAIFNIRFTETEKLADVHKDLELGEIDIKLLMAINKDIIQNRTTSILNIVAAKNISGENIVCNQCHVLDKNILSHESKLSKVLSELVYDDSSKEETLENERQILEQTFKQIFGSTIGFMATRNLPFPLPAIIGSTSKKVKSIRLTHQQLRILMDKALKKIILGNFGTGKTLLALYHLQMIIEQAVIWTVVYYIIWDEYSLSLNDIKKFVSNLSTNKYVTWNIVNIGQITKNLKFRNTPIFSELIKTLLERHRNEELHVIIDECNCERLDKNEARALRELFKTRDELKTSYVVLFPHSLEKHRIFINEGNVVTHDKYKYKDTGMTVYQLNQCMRVTSKTFNALQESQNELSRSNNTITYGGKDIVNNMVDNANGETLDDSPRAAAAMKDRAELNIGYVATQRKKITRKWSLNLKKGRDKGDIPAKKILARSKINVKNENSTIKTIDEETELFDPAVDLEIIVSKAKQTGTDGNFKAEIDLRFTSNVDFVCHNVTGVFPLVVIPKEQESLKCASTLAMLLKGKMLHKKGIQFILSDDESHHDLFRCALHLLDKPYIIKNSSTQWKLQNSEGITLTNFMGDDYILITTTRCARGTEADSVIVCFDPNEHHLRHLFIEDISRSTSNVYLLEMQIYENNSDEGTVGYMVTKMIEKALVDVLLIEDIENGYEECQYAVRKLQFAVNPSLSKTVNCFMVNLLSRKFIEYKNREDNYKKIIAANQLSSSKNTDLEMFNRVLRSFPKFDKASKLEEMKCTWFSGSSCKLSWKDYGNKYIVRRCVMEENQEKKYWQDVAINHNKSEIIINDLSGGKMYTFFVATTNDKEGTSSAELKYEHFGRWFFHDLSREDAEYRLKRSLSGSFLIRPAHPIVLSDRNFFLSLTVGGSAVQHYRIKTATGGYFIWSSCIFKTIYGLVNYYSCNSHDLPCRLTKPYPHIVSINGNMMTKLQFRERLKSKQMKKMWIGTWKETSDVTIRILHTSSTTNFEEEANIFDHLCCRHLIEVYAAFINPETTIISEYMIHGSLLDILKNENIFHLPTCMNMALQVAAGMAYIESKQYCHCSLRASHVFLDANKRCKLDPYHVFVTRNKEYLNYQLSQSLEWLSPEVLMTEDDITIKTNVWSFGILLTEMLSGGAKPYQEISHKNWLENICNGYRVQQLSNCPDSLYEVMRKCWRQEPEARPTFDYLEGFLRDLLLES